MCCYVVQELVSPLRCPGSEVSQYLLQGVTCRRPRRIGLNMIQAERGEAVEVVVGNLGTGGLHGRVDPAPLRDDLKLIAEKLTQNRTEATGGLADVVLLGHADHPIRIGQAREFAAERFRVQDRE